MSERWRRAEKNCLGCPHHAPDGDASWGEAILREREAQRQDYERRQQDMRRQVEEVRQRLRALPHQAKSNRSPAILPKKLAGLA